MELTGGGGREAPSRPLTAEEEALKRNTDCVYFLASPLTCKKGSECEYRHSEGARVNPRDCYYWLNGNCLNLKCTFRHPPLEALFGIPGTSSAPAPSMQIPAAHPPAAHNPNKQSVPCYYFQKGLCLKGDRCLFMHGPPPPATMTAAPQQLLPKVSEPPRTLKKETSHQNFPKSSGDKLVEAPPSMVSQPDNGSVIKRIPSPYSLENDLLRSRQTNVPVSTVSDATEIPWNIQSQLVDERLQNGRDTDEFLGESSPGFDVLVDDDIVDSEYIHNEDEFGRGGRNPYPVTDFNYHHSEYDPVGSFEGDQYNGADEYDRYGPRYGREQQRRTSSERRLDRQSVPERRVRPREESPEMDGSDLRHRLLKQRKLNGSRLAVSPDRRGRRYVEEERYHGRRSHRDHIPRESSISSRLQGRITLPPARSYSPDDLRPLRERERTVNYQGRHQDRTKRRPHEDSRVPSIRRDDHESFRVQPVRRENTDPLNFAGPKSLAELKGAKGSQQESSTKLGKAVGRQESEFEALKPPTNILKTVKETGPDDQIGEEGEVVGFSSAAVSEAEKGVDHTIKPKFQSLEEDEEEEEGLMISADDYNQSKGTAEIEEETIEDEQMLGNLYRKNEESDDEAIEGGDVKAEDDESMYQDGYEDLDDDVDDEEEFATKVNAMFYTE